MARLWLGEHDVMRDPAAQGAARQVAQAESMIVVETNIDDMNPELYASVSRALFGAGARDVWLASVQMKKDRPAVQLSVLGMAADEATLVRALLAETTTLGVRVQPVTRYAAKRTLEQVTTPFGTIQVKVKWLDGVAVGAKPEHDDCVRLAEAKGVPVRAVYEAAAAAAYQSLLALPELQSTSS